MIRRGLRRAGSWALIFGLSSCRIYRDDGDNMAQPHPAASGGASGASSARTRASEAPETPATPAPEALSLWVLNRPQTDLVAPNPEASEGPAPEAVSPKPESSSVSALVVLGLGAPHACAEVFARRALRQVKEERGPLYVVTALLDELRRWRWPEPMGELHATARASDGSFGAVHAAAPTAFSPGMLDAALERHAVIDGRSKRWAKSSPLPEVGPPSAQDAPVAGCESAAGTALHGPTGILLRTAGHVYGGLISVVGQNDAGLMRSVTQYGVSVAVGSMGGVLLIDDCPKLPNEAMAENVYARLGQDVSPTVLETHGGCAIAHAISSGRGARVMGASPLAWAMALDDDVAPPPPMVAPGMPRDAGATPERMAPR